MHLHQIETLYDVLNLFREKIISIQGLRDRYQTGSAQHYWCAYSAKRFELAYEHYQFAALARMHWCNVLVPTPHMNPEDRNIYLAFKEDSRQYWEKEGSTNTLITERLLDLHSSVWFGFESLIKLIIEKNNIPNQSDFTEGYKALIKACRFNDEQEKIEFINGFKLVRHSEHNNYRPKRPFVITIPSLRVRISIDGSGTLDIGNKFYMIALVSDMVSVVTEILSEFEASSKYNLCSGYE